MPFIVWKKGFGLELHLNMKEREKYFQTCKDSVQLFHILPERITRGFSRKVGWGGKHRIQTRGLNSVVQSKLPQKYLVVGLENKEIRMLEGSKKSIFKKKLKKHCFS